MTQNAATIEQQAAEWVARMDAGALGADEQARLDRWVAEDPRHLGALVRARAQWLALDRVGALAAGRAKSPNVVVSSWRRRAVLAAALALGAAVLAVSWSTLQFGQKAYRTDVGEIRRIALSDGSTLVLNTDSEVRIGFTQARRDVTLVRGEGLFEVAHDTQRPFIVRTDHVQVRAVGTMFTVRLRDERVDVTVSEGVVELSNPSSAASPVQKLLANQQSVIAPQAPSHVEEVEPDVLKRRLAWLNGMVSFNGESLGAAIEEINRHSARRIVVEDAALSARPVVGAFRATDAEGFAHTAAAVLDAEAVEDEEVILIRLK